MNVTGDQFGGSRAPDLFCAHDRAIREQTDPRGYAIFRPIAGGNCARTQAACLVQVYFPDKEGFAAAEVAIDTNSVGAGKGDFHGKLPS
jgi:hypothetical protein